jgi:hypothetical protein
MKMGIPGGVATAVGLLKVIPELIDVGKDIWKRLQPPEELARGKGREGVFGRDYYSDAYKFKMSVPDDTWQFWKPTPQFVSGFFGGDNIADKRCAYSGIVQAHDQDVQA